MSKKVFKKVALAGALVGVGLLTGGTGWVALIGKLSLATGIGVGLAAVQGFLDPKDFTQQDLAKNTQITSSPAASRQIAYGQTATAGHLIFRDATGDDNEILHMVLVLAGSEIDSLVGMTVNGKKITLPSMPGGNVTSGNFANKLQVYFHDGADTTAPFSGSSISTLPRWTAKTRKLRGLPAVYVKATIDEDFEGKFEPMFEIKGRKIYDPRLDTTKGGSGSHRFDDPSTWAWSNNPVLQIFDYTPGIKEKRLS